MRTFKTLRVRICSCSLHYHGRLANRTVVVQPPGSSAKGRPYRFRLREIPIPDGQQRETLRAYRCHFFLDFHRVGCRCEVQVVRNVFFNGPGEICRVIIGGSGIDEWRYRMRREWNRPRPQRVDTVVKAAGELLAELDAQRLERWLQTTTPRHWRLPRPPRASCG